jgi:hypothetical protein
VQLGCGESPRRVRNVFPSTGEVAASQTKCHTRPNQLRLPLTGARVPRLRRLSERGASRTATSEATGVLKSDLEGADGKGSRP